MSAIRRINLIVIVTFLLQLTLPQTVSAGIRLCYTNPGVEISEEVRRAAERPGSDWDVPGGYNRLLERVIENRRAIQRGEVSEKMAKTMGGTAITGIKNFPVFPFAYANVSAPITSNMFDQQLFTGPWPTGTLSQYYDEVSYSNLAVGGVVAAIVTVSNNDTYYEDGTNGLWPNVTLAEAMHEILAARDGAIDFTQFDNDGPDGIPNSGDDDGYVDFVSFIHPEFGGEAGGSNIWSHASALSNRTTSYETGDAAASNTSGVTNIIVDRYFVSAAVTPSSVQEGIGTFAHEFGHALGIADLYDTDDDPNASEGIGNWGLMGSANYNTINSPGHMTAWTKERLGWLTYHNVLQSEQLCLPPVETNPIAARLWTFGEITPEYFVVENRQPIGFDQNVYSPGLVIYHIDEDVYDNNTTNTQNAVETHKSIDVECADAMFNGHVVDADDLDAGLNRGDAGDVWCTNTQTTFSPTSLPDSRSYGQGPSLVTVTEIQDCEGDGNNAICASYDVGIPSTVDLCMTDCAGDGCAEISACDFWWGSPDIWVDNNGNGEHNIPAEGMYNQFWFNVKNQGPNTAANVDVTLYYADPALGALWPSTGSPLGSATIPTIAPGATYTGSITAYYPNTPSEVDHYCIGAIATNAVDFQSSEYAPYDNNVAQVNHNILVERAGGSNKTAACTGFLDKTTKLTLYPGINFNIFADLRLGTPPNFNDVLIPAGWEFQFEPGPYDVISGNPVETYVTMQAANVSHGDSAYVPVTLWDPERQEATGGVILEYLIDCVEPAAPENLTNSCVGPFGDAGVPGLVKLDWSNVDRDVNDDPEKVLFYEVWRSDNQGNSMALVQQVAIDAEPSETGFQWYEEVPWDTGYVYTYKLRAVDQAGSPGGFSPTVNVVCNLATSVDAGIPSSGQWKSIARPNPFNPATTISFAMERPGNVTLNIYDAAGRLVEELIHELRGAGDHEQIWNGEERGGNPVASGIYFYRLETSDYTETRKMVLAR